MSEVKVLDITGNLISTTTRCGHIRKLLKTNQAKVVNKTPFTVQLLYKTDTVGKSIDRKDNNIMDTFSVFSPVNSESRDGLSSILSEDLTHCIITGDKNTCKFDIVNKIIDGLDKDTNTLTVILDPNNRWKSEDLEKTESVKNTVLNLLVPYVEMAVEDHAEIFAEVFCETYHLDSDDIVQPFMLEQRLKFMQENPSIDYATSMGESVRVNNDSIVHTGRLWGVQPQKDLLACFLEVDYPFSVWNNIYRTSTMGNYYWDEKVKIYTDFSYIVPCIIAGYKHAFIGSSQVDYFYVVLLCVFFLLGILYIL